MTTDMNQKNTNAKTGKPKVSSRGGARKGAGRPKGSVDKVTIAGLLSAIETQSGRSYMDMLAEDFVNSRSGDRGLAAKYHNLILNKVMATMASVEVTNPASEIEAKQAAFADALSKLAEISKDTK
jgi:hypothetical protein